MCGIVGANSKRDVVAILLEGLKRLEYRGYDSAGLVVLDHTHQLVARRVFGKVEKLVNLVNQQPLHGSIGVAHTRWATHGSPNEINAHPHQSHNTISLVHNGIIENFETLRAQLLENNYQFSSETDSEVIVHLIHYYYQQEKNFLNVLLRLQQVLQGAYALAIINTEMPEQLWAIRRGSPLVIGLGIEENFLASDQLALLPVTNRFIYLQEGDIACLHQTAVTIWDHTGSIVERCAADSLLNSDSASKGSFRHFMLKEIFEQPEALNNLLEQTFEQRKFKAEPFGTTTQQLLERAQHIYIIACGTSYHAGLVAKYWFEDLCSIPCHVEIASEFRYRASVVPHNSLLITISQSGETADTLAALKMAKTMSFIGFLAICNVAESSLARESDAILMTYAGPEIGVASTKAFTNQLLLLLLLALTLARFKGKIINEIIDAVYTLPELALNILTLDDQIKTLAQAFIEATNALFLGRGTNFPVAAEGALKLKELSYIHAEAYPAGELKHGPLALVDRHMPIVLLAPSNLLFEKTYSNAQEIKAREGILFVLTDDNARFAHFAEVLTMPFIPTWLQPILYTIPLQLLAYHVALIKGTDVDQPRNLAKSVTVE